MNTRTNYFKYDANAKAFLMCNSITDTDDGLYFTHHICSYNEGMWGDYGNWTANGVTMQYEGRRAPIENYCHSPEHGGTLALRELKREFGRRHQISDDGALEFLSILEEKKLFP